MVSFITSAQNPAEIDTTFEIGTGFNGGIAYTTVYSIIIDDNDKILVGGDFNSYNGNTIDKIVRLNSDGSIDTSFNTGTGFTNTDIVYSVALQSDGKILVGGDFTSYNNNTPYNFLVRLNTDGSLDTSFNSGGIGFYIEDDNYVRTIMVQSDDKILVGGNLSSYNSDGQAGREIIRLNANGTKDEGFYVPNLTVDTNSNATIQTMALQPDGKILAGGNFTKLSGGSQNRLVRLNNNGLKDNSFNIGTGFDGTVFSSIVQPDGKILVGGHYSTYNGSTSKYLERLNSDGTKDTSFNIGTGFQDYKPVYAVRLQPDGKILVGGDFKTFNGNNQNGLIRLNADGSKDTNFDIGLGFSVSLTSSGVNEISIQPDSKIIVGGTFHHYYNNIPMGHIVRLVGDGVLSTNNYFKETMIIYPNPAIDFVNVSSFEQNENVTILNLNGQIVRSVKIKNDRIDVSDLKTGIYFVKIKNVYSRFIKK